MSSQIKPIEALIRSGATVWTLPDLRILWGGTNSRALRDKIRYHVNRHRLKRLRKGVYALPEGYDPCELAQKLIRPSYISLESALRIHGVIQQYSSDITSIAPYPRVIVIGDRTYRYHRIRGELLSLPIGIERRAHYALATPERALCDALYLGFQPDTGGYHRWDAALLRRLESEFSVPRVRDGLSHLLPRRP